MLKSSFARSSYPDPRLYKRTHSLCTQPNRETLKQNQVKSRRQLCSRYGIACKAHYPSLTQYCTVSTLFTMSIDRDMHIPFDTLPTIYLTIVQVFNKLPAAETPACWFLLWHSEELTQDYADRWLVYSHPRICRLLNPLRLHTILDCNDSTGLSILLAGIWGAVQIQNKVKLNLCFGVNPPKTHSLQSYSPKTGPGGWEGCWNSDHIR